MYIVQHHAYCGLSSIAERYDTEHEAREDIAYRLRRARRRYPVAILTRGFSWEIQSPDDAVMVSDACGTLTLTHEQYECRECGCEHDTLDDAFACCAYTGEDWTDE